MAKNREEVSGGRRNFLKIAGLGTITGGAAIATTGAVQAAPVSDDERGSGYRETGHVKAYYDLARF